MRELPRLYDDNSEVISGLGELLDEPRYTEEFSMLLVPPSMPVINVRRFPITVGFLNGAPTDVIAGGISIGERWIVGPAPYAGASAVWLSNLDLPYRDQIAAWRARGPS